MAVEVKLRGPLKKYGPGSEAFAVTVSSDSCTVKELLTLLNIPPSSVSFVSLNDVKTGLDSLLKSDDRVVIYPRVAGG